MSESAQPDMEREKRRQETVVQVLENSGEALKDELRGMFVTEERDGQTVNVINTDRKASDMELRTMIGLGKREGVVRLGVLEQRIDPTPEEIKERRALRAQVHAGFVREMENINRNGFPVGQDLRERIRVSVPESWEEWIPPRSENVNEGGGGNNTSGDDEGGYRAMTDEEIAQARMNIAVPNQSLDSAGGDGEGAGGSGGGTEGGGRGGGNRRNNGEGGGGDETPPPPDGGSEGLGEEDDDGGEGGGFNAYDKAWRFYTETGSPDLLRRWYENNWDKDTVSVDDLIRVYRILQDHDRHETKKSAGGGDSGNGGNEQLRVEISIEQARELFMGRVHQVLFFTEGNVRLVEPAGVDRILREINAPEAYRREAYAYVALLNRSGIKRQFMDHPAMLFGLIGGVDLQKQLSEDVELERLLRNGYQDRYLVELLSSQDREGQMAVQRAWGVFLGIAEGRVPAGADWAVSYRDAYRGRGFVSLEQENQMVWEVARRLGISEYQARIGFIMFEAFNEPEVNTRHPLYALTHTEKHAETMRALGLWWGSEGWFRISGIRRGDRNGLPDRLWVPVAYQELKLNGEGNPGVVLVDSVRRDQGVDQLLNIIRMKGQGEASVRQKGLLEGSLAEIQQAVGVHKLLTDIGPATPSVKLSEEMLWKLRRSLLALNRSGHLRFSGGDAEVVRVLEAAAKVYFWEMSMECPDYSKLEEKQLRMMSPVAMFERYLRLVQLRDEGGEMVGLFDMEGFSGEDVVERVRVAVIDHMKQMVKHGERLLPLNQQVVGLVGSLSRAMPRREYLTRKEVGEMWKKSKKRDRFGLWGSREW